jgi:hypothetical protein
MCHYSKQGVTSNKATVHSTKTLHCVKDVVKNINYRSSYVEVRDID